MSQNYNTNKRGKPFDGQTKLAVWKKGKIVQGYDASKTRKDLCGAWINWDKHGDTTENGNGWEIDHIKPKSKGGDDELSNLQPLQWQNNRKKGDDYPASDFCEVSAK
ncbi:MAG: HNH endonuclease signature motif containing protein [Bacteroidales bacterium]